MEFKIDTQADNNLKQIKQSNSGSKESIDENSYEEICSNNFDEDINNADFKIKPQNATVPGLLYAATDIDEDKLNNTLDNLLDYIKNNPEQISQSLNEIQPNLQILEPEKKEESPQDEFIIPDTIDIPKLTDIVKPIKIERTQEESIKNSGKYNINEAIESSKQGKLGDCWLLAGLNSLSFSESGKKIIKDAIENNGDGTYTVSFKGISDNCKCTIKDEALDNARKSELYSTGDDDVLLLEIATEAFLRELQDGNIKLPNDAPAFLYDEENNPLNGGFPQDLVYLLTGKNMTYECIITTDTKTGETKYLSGEVLQEFYDNNLEEFYTKFEQNPKNSCGCLHIRNSDTEKAAVIKDTSGNSAILTKGAEYHAWSVKSVDKDTITIVNPWDSSIEVTVFKKDIEKHVFGFEYLEL